MLFKTVNSYTTKEYSHFKFKSIVYVATYVILSNIIGYCGMPFILCFIMEPCSSLSVKVFVCLVLCYYTINNDSGPEPRVRPVRFWPNHFLLGARPLLVDAWDWLLQQNRSNEMFWL